jgi:hypothetical protein
MTYCGYRVLIEMTYCDISRCDYNSLLVEVFSELEAADTVEDEQRVKHK